MPPSDNSTVKITIDVVDANSGEVVSRVTKNLAGLGDAGKKAGTGIADGGKQGAGALDQMGNAGANASKKISDGMQESSGHMMTALDNVRLLSQTLGLRLPRAMEAAISRNAALMGGIATLGTGLLALGAIEVFAHMAEDAGKLYKRMSDVNSEMAKYEVAAANAAQTKLFDTSSAETTLSLVQQTQSKIDALNKKRQTAGVGEDGSGSLVQYLGYGYLSDFHAYKKGDDQQLAAAHQLNDEAKERQRLLGQQEEIEAKVADGSARAASVVGAAARRAKEESEEAIASLKLRQAQLNENNLVEQSKAARARLFAMGVHQDAHLPQIYQADPHAGEAEYTEQMRRIHQQYGAENTADARRQAEETAHITAEAQMANERGEQRYMHERDENLRQLREKLRDTELSPLQYMQRVHDVQVQYAADRQKRLDNEHAETKRMQDEASAGGQTGYARTDAEHAARLDSIQKQSPDLSDPNTAAQRTAAENGRYQQEQDREAGQFTDRLMQLDESRANSSMSTNQKIDAETQRTRNEILKAWQDLYGGLAAMDARRVTSYAEMQKALSQIDADGARQKAQARQQLEDQTAKVEDEGRRSGMSRQQEQRQAIIDAYNERYRELEELRQKDADNADLYRRQEIAAEQEKNGKLLQNERQMRDQLAGQLRGLMSAHPLQAIEHMGEEAASKYMADTILKHTGRGTGTVGASGGRHSALTDMLGLPGGHGNASPAGTGTPHAPAAPSAPSDPARLPPVVASSSNVSAATTTLNANSADIHIGQATFTGMSGGGSGAVSAPAAMAAAGGGTTVVQQGGGVGNAGAGVAAGTMPMLVQDANGANGANGAAGVAGAAGAAGANGTTTILRGGAGNAGTSTAMMSGGAGIGSAGYSGTAGVYGGGISGTASAGGTSLPGYTSSTAGMGGMSLPGYGSSTASTATPTGGAASLGMAGTAVNATRAVVSPSTGGAMGTANRAIGGVQEGLQGAQQVSKLASMFGGADDDVQRTGALGMDPTTKELGQSLYGDTGSSGGGGASGVSSALGTAGQAIGGGAAVFGAIMGNGGGAGALQGMMGGMQLGSMVGGPIGAAVGAAAGAVLGFIGIGGRSHAEDYYNNTIKPHITNTMTSFGMGSMDYTSAYNDMVALDKQARDDMKKFGMGGKSVWDNEVHPAIIGAEKSLESEYKAGRSQYGMSAAEFHGGGLVNGFGDMSTGPDTGWAHLQRGETVMHQSATSMHGDALSLMLAGASRSDMAGYYGAGTMQSAGGGGDTHVHLNAIDTQTGLDFLMSNKHGVRAAVNQSYAENSGGSDYGG